VSPLALDREVGEIRVDVEEGRARHVTLEIELVPALWTSELPTTVGELIPDSASLRK
jgi:hypothetical protein